MRMIPVPQPTERQAAKILFRLWPQPNGCSYWTGCLQKAGYGCVGLKYDGRVRIYLVHRVVWVIHNGPIPDGLLVLHSCESNYAPNDRSFKQCANIEHMVLGTPLDNAHDRIVNGRERKGYQRGEHNPNAHLTSTDVATIRQMRQQGYTMQDIGNRVGTSLSNVSLIVLGKNWSHTVGVS